jgi:putative hemolysin
VIDLLILMLLVLAGGVLAGAEMALVTARRGRLEQQAEAGSHRARAALRLRRHPEHFLASIQVGITLLGAIAAAFGGASLAGQLENVLHDAGFGDAAENVAFVAVVGGITYLSVVFGELVPKSLALRFADNYAVFIARPMVVLGWIVRPIAWLLTASSNAVLRLFGDRTNFVEGRLSREDLEHLVEEASTQGGIDASTGRLMSRAIEFSQLRVQDIMVPRRFVVSVPHDAGAGELRRAMLDQGHRRVPVHEESVDRIVGYVLREDVLACLWNGEPIAIGTLRREPYFVPGVMPAERALRELQARQLHLAVVVDEHGVTAGLITLEDLIEELVGEIFHEDDAQTKPIQREGPRTWKLQGGVALRDVWRELQIELPERGEGRTIAGLMVAAAGDRVPTAGERLPLAPGVIGEVVEASARRVRVVRLHVSKDAS